VESPAQKSRDSQNHWEKQEVKMDKSTTQCYKESLEALRDARANEADDDLVYRMLDAIELIVMRLANDADKVDELLREFPHLKERFIKK
jgi:hypothetical protein